MKSLCILSILAVSTSVFALENNAFALENNAFVHLTQHGDYDITGCIFYEGHYYYAPKVEHYGRCPCQIDTSFHKTP